MGASFLSYDSGATWTLASTDPRLVRVEFAASTVTLVQDGNPNFIPPPGTDADATVDIAACVAGGVMASATGTSVNMGKWVCDPDPDHAPGPYCSRTVSVVCTLDGIRWFDVEPLPEATWRSALTSVNGTAIVAGGSRMSNSTTLFAGLAEVLSGQLVQHSDRDNNNGAVGDGEYLCGYDAIGGPITAPPPAFQCYNITSWIGLTSPLELDHHATGSMGTTDQPAMREFPVLLFSRNQSVHQMFPGFPVIPYPAVSHLPTLYLGGGYPRPRTLFPPTGLPDLYTLVLPESLTAGQQTLDALIDAQWKLLSLFMPTAKQNALQLMAELGGNMNSTTLVEADQLSGIRYLIVATRQMGISPNMGAAFIDVNANDMCYADAGINITRNASNAFCRGGTDACADPFSPRPAPGSLYGTQLLAMPLAARQTPMWEVNPATSFAIQYPTPTDDENDAPLPGVLIVQRGPYLIATKPSARSPTAAKVTPTLVPACTSRLTACASPVRAALTTLIHSVNAAL